MNQSFPKIQIIEDEIWVCIGHKSLTSTKFGIVLEGQWKAEENRIRADERKRMAFLLDNINEFPGYLQWRGQDPSAGGMLPQTNIWQNDPSEPNIKKTP